MLLSVSNLQMQEYVEAAATLCYAKSGQLLTFKEANAQLTDVLDASGQAFQLSISDYLLGVRATTSKLPSPLVKSCHFSSFVCQASLLWPAPSKVDSGRRQLASLSVTHS
jgi:hypothetical protein